MSIFFDKLMFWLAWRLPYTLVYYCALRVAANVTCGEFGNCTPSEISMMDMLKAWHKKQGGDKSFTKNKVV